MKLAVILPIVIGSTVLIVGGVLLGVAIAHNNKVERVTNTHEITQNVANLSIDVSTANVEFKVSDDGSKKVVCEETAKYYHEVDDSNNTLTIKSHDTRKWYEKIFAFNTFQMKVTVYLPAQEFDSATIRSSTGNITMPKDYSFNNMTVKLSTGNLSSEANVAVYGSFEASTGKISLSNMNAKDLNIKASTGNINLTGVNASEGITVNTSTGNIKLTNTNALNFVATASTGNVSLVNSVMGDKITVNTSTGNVTLTDSDAQSLKIKTTTGNVTGVLLTSKIFYAKSTTGRINVPISSQGGICEVETTTGNITFTIKA